MLVEHCSPGWEEPGFDGLTLLPPKLEGARFSTPHPLFLSFDLPSFHMIPHRQYAQAWAFNIICKSAMKMTPFTCMVSLFGGSSMVNLLPNQQADQLMTATFAKRNL